ncbi:2-hydroxyglutaryl-CoA dehydratase, D-component [bacterium BMS3Abin01]|nr:2-hydroxyglutaryl-CoA dehydratase, D-component [bacterium BMS3Abin01]
MGNLHFMLDDLFGRLGVDYIRPPASSTRTLQIGAQHSPEFACLPLKINIGNFIEAMEAGADTLIMAGGHGPCRFGYYGIVEERILRDLGYDFKFMMLEPFNDGAWAFYKTFEALSPGLSIRKLWKMLKVSFSKARAFDRLYKRALQLRAYEVNLGDTSRTLRQAEEILSRPRTPEEIEAAAAEAMTVIEAVEQDPGREVMRVGIVGEFYLLLEPFSNFGLEETLGHMDVYLERSVWVTDWIAPNRDNIIYGYPKKDIEKKAEPFLDQNVGGEGRETIGSIVMFAERGFDGIIQLLPFGCMPENIATSIIPRVQQEHDIPVLTLAFDEQTGRAGVITRVEAFLDLLAARRRSKAGALRA